MDEQQLQGLANEVAKKTSKPLKTSVRLTGC